MGPLLLVPKVLVRRRLEYDYDDYYTHYLLPFLRDAEIAQRTALVTVVKSAPTVYKQDLRKKYGTGKHTVVSQTLKHPEVLNRYRRDKREQRRVRRPALTHDALADFTAGERPNWEALLANVTALPPGNEAAAAYHKAVFHLLTALFYPSLTNGRIEQEIHGGLKRIDIAFDNAATSGFFHWLGMHHYAPVIVAECKNYGRELGNPELDQMIGRLSPARAEFGLIVCRSLEDPARFYERCQHTADDSNGYIVALTDDDLVNLVAAVASGGLAAQGLDLLRTRFQRLIFRAKVPPADTRHNQDQ